MSVDSLQSNRIEWNPEQTEAFMLTLPQVECPVEHHFAPGMYYRQTTMPAGSIVIGHEHKTEHLNVVSKGRAIVLIDGVRHEVKAPFVVTSKPGSRKIALVLEDLVWATVHLTDETDPDKLESILITKSQAFIENSIREALELKEETKQITERNGGTL